jgi:hypothetical protein
MAPEITVQVWLFIAGRTGYVRGCDLLNQKRCNRPEFRQVRDMHDMFPFSCEACIVSSGTVVHALKSAWFPGYELSGFMGRKNREDVPYHRAGLATAVESDSGIR